MNLRVSNPRETALRLEGAAELCAVLSAALRAGLTPERCFEVAGIEPTDERLRVVAGGLVGRCWEVAVESGSAPGIMLGTLGHVLLSLAQVMRQADVAAAGPRATLRLVTWLPVASLGIAQLAGIPALTVLLTTGVGWLLLLSGVALILLARWWLSRLVAGATQLSWAIGLAPDLMAMVLRSGASPAVARELVSAIPVDGYLTSEDRDNDARACDAALTHSDEWGLPGAALLELNASLMRRAHQHIHDRSLAALGVRVLVPLGVCVLPAFVLLAVVPSVLALLSSTGLSTS